MARRFDYARCDFQQAKPQRGKLCRGELKSIQNTALKREEKMVRYPIYTAQELRSMLCGSDTDVLRREKAYNFVAGNQLEPAIYTLTKGEAKAAIRIAEQDELLVGSISKHFKNIESGKLDPTLDDADMYPFARQLIDVIDFDDGPIDSIYRLLIIEIVSSYIIQTAARCEEVEI